MDLVIYGHVAAHAAGLRGLAAENAVADHNVGKAQPHAVEHPASLAEKSLRRLNGAADEIERHVLLQRLRERRADRFGQGGVFRRKAGAHEAREQQDRPRDFSRRCIRGGVPVKFPGTDKPVPAGSRELDIRAADIYPAEAKPRCAPAQVAQLLVQRRGVFCLSLRQRDIFAEIGKSEAKGGAAIAFRNAPGDADNLAVAVPGCFPELKGFAEPVIQGAKPGVFPIKVKPKLPPAVRGENVIDAGVEVILRKAALLLRLPAGNGAGEIPLCPVVQGQPKQERPCRRVLEKGVAQLRQPEGAVVSCQFQKRREHKTGSSLFS